MAWYKFYNYCYTRSVQTFVKIIFLQVQACGERTLNRTNLINF